MSLNTPLLDLAPRFFPPVLPQATPVTMVQKSAGKGKGTKPKPKADTAAVPPGLAKAEDDHDVPPGLSKDERKVARYPEKVNNTHPLSLQLQLARLRLHFALAHRSVSDLSEIMSLVSCQSEEQKQEPHATHT